MEKQTKVFISYSHDTDAHRERVLALSERLRLDGFEAQLDQYVNGTPEEYWPRWMLNRLDEAAFVLVVCTETYYWRFRGHEQPGRGHGVDWEGAIITQEIYNSRSRTVKFVPVLFETTHKGFIPEPLSGHTHYMLGSEADYERLRDFLDGCAGVEPGPVGTRPKRERRRSSPLTFDESSSSVFQPKISPPRLPARSGAQKLFGRNEELEQLNEALVEPHTHLVQLVAWGGVGKTALVTEWMTNLAAKGWRTEAGDEIRYFDWSFYSQGTRDRSSVSSDTFIATALAFFGDPDPQSGSPHDRGARLAQLINQQPTVLILDGMEPLQYGPGPLVGCLQDPALLALLKGLAQHLAGGVCLVTTRERLVDLDPFQDKTVMVRELEHLDDAHGAKLLHHAGATRRGEATIDPKNPELRTASREVRGHALTLNLLGAYLKRAHGGDIRRRDRVRFWEADRQAQGGHAFRVIAAYEQWLGDSTAVAKDGWIGGKGTGSAGSPGAVSVPFPSVKGVLVGIINFPRLAVSLIILHMSLLCLKIGLLFTEPNFLILDGRFNLGMAKFLRAVGNSLHKIGNYIAADDDPPRKAKAEENQRNAEVANRQRMLTILHLLSFFDRPAPDDALAALRRAPAIPGLTDSLVDITQEDWNIALESLRDLGLVSGQMDTHPLVRAYFAEQLGGTSAWKDGHRRLYEHLTQSSPHQPHTLEGLQPLYQAVAHGCQAGLHEKACADVYRDRILRGTGHGGFYSTKTLGAIGADLGAVACFFTHPWRELSGNLSSEQQAWLFNEAATRLRALGRLREALAPMRAGLEMCIRQEDWGQAARSAGNLSQLELTLGALELALADAERSVAFADRSENAFQQMGKRITYADALHQAGESARALALFRVAEEIQAEAEPDSPRLYSVRGFQYCDLLLSDAERVAWRVWMGIGPARGEAGEISEMGPGAPTLSPHGIPVDVGGTQEFDARIADCDRVTARAEQWIEWRSSADSVLDIALDHLTLARAGFYRALLSTQADGEISGGWEFSRRDVGTQTLLQPAPTGIPEPDPATNSNPKFPLSPEIRTHLTAAIHGLRGAGMMDDLPRGLLTCAWYRAATGDGAGALADLEEAWAVAERGPMPLFQADILLTRARLFGGLGIENSYPWGSALEDLGEARRLVEKHGYHRRDEELTEAEAIIGQEHRCGK
uniref:AAA ATPase domain-containing protein n=1 Tax=Candidatus Kentrum sp. TUN TaxID=2126343 RepID=A0A450ZDL0_9GAMM|nr:MAG: AAA ATPase domain-containing protein [Candidatus Kentron sp. TUN]